MILLSFTSADAQNQTQPLCAMTVDLCCLFVCLYFFGLKFVYFAGIALISGLSNQECIGLF